MQQNAGPWYLEYMNPRLLYPLLLSTVLSVPAFAQMPAKITGELETSPYYNNHKWFAKVNFTSLFDPQAPTIQTGIEYKIKKNLAAELNFGIPFKWMAARPTDSTYSNHYKVKFELRFFPGKSLFYIGPEVFFTKKKRSKFDGVYKDKDAETYAYTYAELNKTIIGAALKGGRVWEISERCALDGFFAIGTRYVHLDVKAEGVQPAPGYRWLYWTSDKRGSTTGIHLAAGLKLAFALK
jgi:hypothetical protein